MTNPPPPPTNPPTPKSAGLLVKVVLPVIILAALFLGFRGYQWFWHPQGQASLVVYCSQDQVFADTIIAEFTKETGIHVDIKYDTEATKSLGLTQLLIAEQASPRCDVFWNNELLGTLDLAQRGMFQSYKGTGYERMPAACKDADGRWAGFAARLRVYILNTNAKPYPPARAEIVPFVSGRSTTEPNSGDVDLFGINLLQLTVDGFLSNPDLSRFALAEPVYGTTLTQFCVMWHDRGPEKTKAWYADLLKRKAQVVRGNAVVKDLVAQGVCDLGMTDTDDYFDAVDDGKPVAMTPILNDAGQAICIPNTVAIIKGAQHLDAAQKFVDFLLSQKVEEELAQGKSRQMPLGKVDESKIPPQVRALLPWAAKACPLSELGPARQACIEWLKPEAAH